MSEIGLTDKDIEEWLYNRLGPGNVFEQFNRDFCKDLARAAVKKVVEYLEKHNDWPRIVETHVATDVGHLFIAAKYWKALKAVGKEE